MPTSIHTDQQYQAATTAAGLYIRNDRALLDITGADRAAWLHNLVTNIVTTLDPRDGNYAFATNVKGRTLFDMNILVRTNRLWLDIHRRWIEKARTHFDRYIITEDVEIADVSAQYARLAVLGPAAHQSIERLGLGNLTPMAQLQHADVTIAGAACLMIRHDFAGVPAAEFVVPADSADQVRAAIESSPSGEPLPTIDPDTIQTLRIEAGIPASLDDIDEGVIPPETGQIERGISYHKGCYLGQEVIERMRSRGGAARALVGIHVEGDALPELGTIIRCDDTDVGRVTSSCLSPALDAVLALGYLKTPHAKPGTAVRVITPGGELGGLIVALPVRSN